MEIVILTLLVILMVMLIINTALFFKQRKTESAVENYYELKYRIQYHAFVFITITSVVGLLGWRSYKELTAELKQEIKSELKDVTARLDSTVAKQDSLNKLQVLLEDDINKSISQAISAKSQVDLLNHDLGKLNKRLKQYKETQVFYTNDLFYSTASFEKEEIQTFYFADLKTRQGDHLPKFSKAPIISVIGTSAWLTIMDLNQDYVKLGMASYSQEEVKNGNIMFSLMIVDVASVR